jgi:ATP-dependent helicase/nuclease subunit B
VKITFLLGGAGSGKTYRCLEEIKSELKASQTGTPLVFLAPKQFTFQIERQILSDPEIEGYSRLYILSFDKLASLLISNINLPERGILSDAGRVMVIHSLLSKLESDLKVYKRCIRHPGFSSQLSEILHEFQSFGFTVDKMKSAAQNERLPQILRDKLSDLSGVLGEYLNWLGTQNLTDASRMLEIAADAAYRHLSFKIGKLWMDGFATLTELEIEFLVSVLPHCEEATLAFCVDSESCDSEGWFARSYTVGTAFSKLKKRLEIEKNCEISIQCLKPRKYQVVNQPVIGFLERHWGDFSAPSYNGDVPKDESRWWEEGGIRIISCSNPVSEIICAARIIREYVRKGGRYREVAVLMRRLEQYHDTIRRIFRNYDIPFFMDRRETVTHHPLAELVRYGLRLVAYGWQQEDLFGLLKLGFSPASEYEIDILENEALANGWSGRAWQLPLSFPDNNKPSEYLEDIRRRVIEPLIQFERKLSGREGTSVGAVSAKDVVSALTKLFIDLKVGDKLTQWQDELQALPIRTSVPPAIHQTVLEEIKALFENLELAFGDEKKSLTEWIQIIEAGLSSLTVGVIPPSLDQVLVGAIDRSRNPQLKMTIVVGLTDSVFPETPKFSPILNESERAILAEENIYTGMSLRMMLATEWYLGYIACTRPDKYLVLTHAETDWHGRPLNPSPFITHVQRLIPGIKKECFAGVSTWLEAVHPHELVGILTRDEVPPAMKYLTVFDGLHGKFSAMRNHSKDTDLNPSVVSFLFGNTIWLSVSGLEDYASCPFKYFVRYVLKAEERILYEVDVRHLGAFQHAILERFHKSIISENKKWRDLTPQEAADRIAVIAEEVMREYNNELFLANPSNLFQARMLVLILQEFIKVNIGWMRSSYRFNPEYVEISFGDENAGFPAIEVKVGDGKCLKIVGRIDRIDVCNEEGFQELPCVIIDYKSGSRKLDPVLLNNGIQLQLPLYLLVISQLKNLPGISDSRKITPAGVFFVNLRGDFTKSPPREKAIGNYDDILKEAYQYHGRFNIKYLTFLDSKPDGNQSKQFSYKQNKDGTIRAGCVEAMDDSDFNKFIGLIKEMVAKHGENIFSGRFKISPWRKKNGDCACDEKRCQYQNICRIDFLTHKWKIIR